MRYVINDDYKRKFVFIETSLRSTLKKFFGRYHHLTLSYRVSVTTMVNFNERERERGFTSNQRK